MAGKRVVGGGIATLAVILAAFGMVQHHEGLVLKPYKDPVGVLTACAGETNREVVTMRKAFTRDECMVLLGASMLEHAQRLDQCIHVPLKQHEAVAVLSFGYNVGTGAACGSTMVRMINAGAPASQWCAQLSRWTYAGNRQLPGLVKRRAEERKVCEGKA